METLEERVDRLYAELADIKREMILNRRTEWPANEAAWEDFLALSEEISSRWTGPGAVEEIRSQREK